MFFYIIMLYNIIIYEKESCFIERGGKMIYGIGIDIVELERIKNIIVEKPAMIQKILTKKELEKFDTLSEKRKVEYLAGRFSCKEAFSKAYGTGLGKLGLRDIEILSGESGKPVVTQSPFEGKVHVSISHTDQLATAQIILEK